MAKVQLDGILRLSQVYINPAIFKQISRATAGLPVNINATVKSTQQLNTQMTQVQKTVNKTQQGMVGMSNIARSFVQRMAQFAVLLPTFVTLNRAIQGGVAFIADFEHELAKVVRTDPTELADKMDLITDSVFEMSVALGSTGSEVLKTVKVFKQAGETIERSLELARAATLAEKTTTLDLASAQEVLIAVTKQFSAENLTATQIVDKLGKVEDAAAVDAIDLAEALRTGGNSLAFAAKSLEDTFGLIGALREQTRKSGREIGTFFKTISTRILATGESKDAIEALGITVENFDGSLRPLLPILQDVKVKFDAMTEAQQANAAKAIAGVRQVESFIATLESLGRAQQLSKAAADSDGVSQKRLEIILATLSSQTDITIAKFQELAGALGQAGVLDIFKEIVKFGGNIASGLSEAVKVADKLGVSIAPLLALAGLKIGAKIFGIQGPLGGPLGGQPQRTGPVSLGAGSTSAAAGPTSAFNAALQTATKAVMAFGVTTNTAAGVQKTTANTTSKFFGTVNTFQKGLQNSAASVIAQTKQAQALRAAQSEQMGATAVLVAGYIGLSTAQQAVSMGFEQLATTQKGFLTSTQEVVKRLTDLGFDATQTALAFAPLGGKAALLAGALSLLVQGVNKAVQTFTELGELNKVTRENERRFEAFDNVLAEVSKDASGIGLDIINAIEAAIESNKGRIDTSKIIEEVGKIGKLKGGVKDFFGFDPQDIFDAKFIEGLSKFNERLLETKKLAEEGAPRETVQRQFFEDLGADYSEFTKEFKTRTLEIEDVLSGVSLFEKAAESERKLIDARTELQSIQAANIKLFESEIEVRKRELEASQNTLDFSKIIFDRLTDLVRQRPEGFGIKATPNKSAEEAADEFLSSFSKALAESGPAAQGFLTKFFEGKNLDNEQKQLVNDIFTLTDEMLARQVNLTKKAADLDKAVRTENFEIAQANTDAIKILNNALNETKLSFIDLGLGINASNQDIDTLASLTSKDFAQILRDAGNFSDGVRNAVKLAFGTDVEKAEAQLRATTERTSLQVSILTDRLAELDKEIQSTPTGTLSQKSGKSVAQLTKERSELQADLDKTEAQGKTELVKANFSLRDALKSNAQKVKELDEAIRKVRDTQKAFKEDLLDTEQAYKDFLKEKFADLAQQEASAEEELATAHQGVIEASSSLSDTYNDLISTILDYNSTLAKAAVESNLLGLQIAELGGGLNGLQERLFAINDAFVSVLSDANITLQTRIELERQLAQETLSFLQQAQSQITSAGLDVFGQSAEENRSLGEGIAGLALVADKLGGSFDSFLKLSDTEFKQVGDELLSLPLELRQKILDALGTLPSTVQIGGFSPEELKTALGQVGAGVAPEEGLPAVEDLLSQQKDQLVKLQDLAIRDAQLQVTQVLDAQRALELAEVQLEAAKIQEERARENAIIIRDEIAREVGVLQFANEQREALTERILMATKESELNQIESEARNFERQIGTFHEVGGQIVQAIDRLASAKLAIFQAGTSAGELSSRYAGYVPNFGGGNLSPQEASAILKAAEREKRMMPGGADLAIANTKETIIPNYANGSSAGTISAAINDIRALNSTMAGAIARSVTSSVATIPGAKNDEEQNTQQITERLDKVVDTLEQILIANSSIASNTDVAVAATPTIAAPETTVSDININVITQQNAEVRVTGLNDLEDALKSAIKGQFEQQFDSLTVPVNEAIRSIFKVLRERGIMTSFGGPQ